MTLIERIQNAPMSSVFDFVLGPLFLLLILIVVIIRKRKYKKLYPNIVKYYYPAFAAKILFTLLIIWFFDFLVQGYDMVGYYRATNAVYDAFWTNYNVWIEMMTKDAHTFSDQAVAFFNNNGVSYYAKSEKIMKLCRPAFFLSLITGKSIYGIGFIVGYFGFMASWRSFLVFHELFPKPRLSLAIPCLFIPSTLFWGSAPLMRDTFALIGLSYSFYAAHRLINSKRLQFKYYLLLSLGLFCMFQMKQYIAFAFIPSILLWWVLVKSSSKKKKFTLNIKRALMLIIGLIIGFIAIYYLTLHTRYRIDNVFTYLRQTQNYHEYLNVASNALGYRFEYNDSFLGILGIIPSAIIVSIYRPYLWETMHNFELLPNAIEGTISLLVSIYIFVKIGIFTLIKTIFSNPHLTAFIFFSFSYLALIGLATYNFGSLVRYKIPGLMFFYATIAIAFSEKNSKSH